MSVEHLLLRQSFYSHTHEYVGHIYCWSSSELFDTIDIIGIRTAIKQLSCQMEHDVAAKLFSGICAYVQRQWPLCYIMRVLQPVGVMNEILRDRFGFSHAGARDRDRWSLVSHAARHIQSMPGSVPINWSEWSTTYPRDVNDYAIVARDAKKLIHEHGIGEEKQLSFVETFLAYWYRLHPFMDVRALNLSRIADAWGKFEMGSTLYPKDYRYGGVKRPLLDRDGDVQSADAAPPNEKEDDDDDE